MSLSVIALAAALQLVTAPAEGAEALPNQVSRPKVTATLLSDTATVTPAGTLRVGVRYEMAEHWHIYWRYSGDTGLVTELDFAGPASAELSGVRWPVPQRFETKTKIVSYGYERPALLFVDVTLPGDLVPGAKVSFSAHTSWLVCEVSCIPGKAKLGLTLTVGESAVPSEAAPLFDASAALVPVPGPRGLELSASTPGDDGVRKGQPFTWELSVRDGAGALLEDVGFVPEPSRGLLIKRTEVISTGDGVPTGGALIRITGQTGEVEADGVDNMSGVLSFKRQGEVERVHTRHLVPRLTGSGAAIAPETPTTTPPPQDAPEANLALMFLFALIGGLILNVMPCVLPVLSIKVLGLVQQAGDDERSILLHGVAYTVGILLSFAGMGAVMIGLQASGEAVGWGFQMQDPAFVAALATLVFAFGLNLFGVFEVQLPGSGRLDSYAASQHGFAGSFFNGVFATVLATPCTAPFLAPALGFAVSQPPAVLLALLLTVGAGLALPFLVLAMVPAWAQRLPRPGDWMFTFKKIMGFLLIGTTVWLLDTLGQQLSQDALWGFLAFLAVVGLAAWIYGHWGGITRTNRTRVLGQLAALGVLLWGGATFLSMEPPAPATAAILAPRDGPPVLEGEIQWRDFRTTDVEQLSRDGHTVFVDFTAAWCATCKYYEATVIDRDSVKAVFTRDCVAPVKADWTLKGPKIRDWLTRFRRAGVPMYLVLPAQRPSEVILLPDLLTTGDLLEALGKAGASTYGECGS